MTDHGKTTEVEFTLTDFKGHIEPLEWSVIPEDNQFLKCGLVRGMVNLTVVNVTPRHAIRCEYNGSTYYGVADDDGFAELLEYDTAQRS